MMLFDTSYLLDMLKEKKFEEGSISVITLIEVLRGTKKEKRKVVKELLEESFNVVGIDNEVVEVYCKLYDELRKKGTIIPDVDLIIASTAISKKLRLMTKDRDFEKLKIVKWVDEGSIRII
mgnify:CR=1 FL=1